MVVYHPYPEETPTELKSYLCRIIDERRDEGPFYRTVGFSPLTGFNAFVIDEGYRVTHWAEIPTLEG